MSPCNLPPIFSDWFGDRSDTIRVTVCDYCER
jgi:hypothetical protein